MKMKLYHDKIFYFFNFLWIAFFFSVKFKNIEEESKPAFNECNSEG